MSYLNTVPLVWGALNGPQKGKIDLTFAVPSICATRVDEGVADAGIIPVIEAARLGMETLPSIGIACTGEVRSILLISKVPFDQVRTLAADTGSRTSVQLSRIVLSRKFGADPLVFPAAPNLNDMLRCADAALLIGDAALSIDPAELSHHCLDLGEEWFSLTGLPMVFALWSGRPGSLTSSLVDLLQGSCQFGLENLDQIIAEESGQRGFTHHLVDTYLRQQVDFEFDQPASRGAANLPGSRPRVGQPRPDGGIHPQMMTTREAVDLFRDDDLIGLGMAADAVRRRHHPENVVTYIIDRNINYTNFCTEYCSFCAFYRPMGHNEGYVHGHDVILQKIQETLDLGGTGVLMQGGLHPDLSSNVRTCSRQRTRFGIGSGCIASRPRFRTSPRQRAESG